MSDTRTPKQWSDAFAALPLEQPATDGWSRVAARLDARKRARWPMWLATAAALLLAIALPWRIGQRSTDLAPHTPAKPAIVATTDSLEQLYAESAQLEALLAMARDERVSSGSAAAMAGDLDRQLASIDAALMQPDLPPARQLALWRDRVEALRAVVGFEGTRRWLAAQGERYDGALALVD
ncbi:hypothetical protein [Lysobacter sp. CFH 32150]|uniref:hypothetical protein n=1 Tax=Lysobacter sp. CFH 32150 TaxID=2927128 RepID=UPI001FA6DE2E|nr:hypothetical protein [Lysobacter sp. CFH 32150]MCI4568657.1 hypothetical protein [Lysobacter sp. CFH 32150]